ncbi:MAG: glycosyltransferase [Fervidobacterium sp.]|nr:glycosyltransferase [Fervidobacterium sp.]
MKVSVLMPTYNDEKYLGEAIESVLVQEGIDVEVVVVNDGSTDNTDEVIKRFKSRKIIYVKQENKGQLNALFTASRYLTGDFVCLFHSDDLIVNKNSFVKNVDFILSNNLDGCYGDYVKIDETGNEKGLLEVPKRLKTQDTLKLLLLKGSNFIGDHFFVTRFAFYKSVLTNYVIWNMPYWFYKNKNQLKILNLKYNPEPWYKYRVHSENYVHSEIGKLEIFNGVARTIVTLSNYYNVIPLPYQKKLPVQLYKLPFTNRSLKEFQVYALLKSLLKKYSIKKQDPYFNAVLNSYRFKSNELVNLDPEEVKSIPILLGKDARLFFTKLREKFKLYENLIEKATHGKFTVCVDKRFERKLNSIRRFLNINFDIRAG